MKVGIIGSGIVGQVLAKAFKTEGYEVTLGTRNTSKEDVVKFNKVTKTVVKDFLILFEWETEDMGQIEAARAIEPLAILWCIPGFIGNQWTHAFKLLKM